MVFRNSPHPFAVPPRARLLFRAYLSPIYRELLKTMLKIRLRRQGATHAPFYRVVVSDSLKTPSARTLEQIGHYDPKKNPADVKIDRTRVDYWVSKGAQLSPTVKSLIKKLPK